MKKTIVLILSSLLIMACSKQEETKVSETDIDVLFPKDIREALEMCYFEGQRDALSGDVRIEEIESGCYKWTSSPWDSGEEPIYKPCPDNK